MTYWLLKSEPDSYGWDDLVRDGGTEWDGVRNHAAAKYLRAMAQGDRALFYHSGKDKAAVGIARIARAAQADGDEGWVSVRVETDHPVPRAPCPVPRAVTLVAIKAEGALENMAMLRQSRISVSPVSDAEWAVVMGLAGEP